jgi:hypothetical protein
MRSSRPLGEGIQAHADAGAESPEALDVAPGMLGREQALEALDSGLYVSNSGTSTSPIGPRAASPA